MLQHLLAPRALLEFKCFERQRHMICILGDERPLAGDVAWGISLGSWGI